MAARTGRRRGDGWVRAVQVDHHLADLEGQEGRAVPEGLWVLEGLADRHLAAEWARAAPVGHRPEDPAGRVVLEARWARVDLADHHLVVE